MTSRKQPNEAAIAAQDMLESVTNANEWVQSQIEANRSIADTMQKLYGQMVHSAGAATPPTGESTATSPAKSEETKPSMRCGPFGAGHIGEGLQSETNEVARGVQAYCRAVSAMDSFLRHVHSLISDGIRWTYAPPKGRSLLNSFKVLSKHLSEFFLGLVFLEDTRVAAQCPSRELRSIGEQLDKQLQCLRANVLSYISNMDIEQPANSELPHQRGLGRRIPRWFWLEELTQIALMEERLEPFILWAEPTPESMGYTGGELRYFLCRGHGDGLLQAISHVGQDERMADLRAALSQEPSIENFDHIMTLFGTWEDSITANALASDRDLNGESPLERTLKNEAIQYAMEHLKEWPDETRVLLPHQILYIMEPKTIPSGPRGKQKTDLREHRLARSVWTCYPTEEQHLPQTGPHVSLSGARWQKLNKHLPTTRLQITELVLGRQPGGFSFSNTSELLDLIRPWVRTLKTIRLFRTYFESNTMDEVARGILEEFGWSNLSKSASKSHPLPVIDCRESPRPKEVLVLMRDVWKERYGLTVLVPD